MAACTTLMHTRQESCAVFQRLSVVPPSREQQCERGLTDYEWAWFVALQSVICTPYVCIFVGYEFRQQCKIRFISKFDSERASAQLPQSFQRKIDAGDSLLDYEQTFHGGGEGNSWHKNYIDYYCLDYSKCCWMATRDRPDQLQRVGRRPGRVKLRRSSACSIVRRGLGVMTEFSFLWSCGQLPTGIVEMCAPPYER